MASPAPDYAALAQNPSLQSSNSQATDGALSADEIAKMVSSAATPKASKTSPDVTQALGGQDDILNMIKGNQNDTKVQSKEYKERTDPLLQREADIISKPLPETPKYQDVLSFQDVQKSIDEGHKAAQSWASGIAVVGALLGGIAKKHTVTGVSALAGALEGLKDGDDAQTKRKMEEFKASNDAIRQHNDMLNQQYKDVLENRKIPLNEMKGLLNDIALQHGDLVAAQSAQRGDIAAFVNLTKERNKEVQKMGELGDQAFTSAENISEIKNYKGQQYIDFLKTAKPNDPGFNATLNEVMNIANGDAAPYMPRSGQTLSPKAEMIMKMVDQYDPTYKVERYTQKQAEAKSLNGQSITQNKIYVQTAKQHIAEAKLALAALDNSNFIPYNKLTQMSDQTILDKGDYGAKLMAYKTAVDFLTGETAKSLAGPGGGTEADRNEIRSLAQASNSTSQSLGALNQMDKMVGDRLNVIDQMRQQAGAMAQPTAAPAAAPSADGWSIQKVGQ